ncbi:MAG: glycosyltransferase family 39 protein [Anaerolineae bacterium]|nr:glycosyltransferase family 39 protein [Anaerolineae bacterium]
MDRKPLHSRLPQPRLLQPRWLTLILLLLILLLGAALRFYRLDAQSLWNDEGNTARLVERSLRLIIEGAAGDIHPPAYYLLLAGWRTFAGGSEFALRAFSALCGVLTVAVAAALGQRAGGRPVAVGSAFFAAVHPLAVYYGQETRMYALLALAGALTLLAAAAFFPAKARPLHAWNALLLAGGILLGLYTQYTYALFLLAVELAFGLAWLAERPFVWGKLRWWIVAHLLALLGFLPWLRPALKVTSWNPPDLNSGHALLELVHALLAGVTLPVAAGGLALLSTALLGLLLVVRHPRVRFLNLALPLTAWLPLVLIAALGIYRPAYLKFLTISIAPLAVTLALPLCPRQSREALPGNLIRISQWVALVLGLLFLPVWGASLRNLYANPVYARADYRGIAARIQAEGGADATVLLSAPNQWEVFTYYFHGPHVLPAPYHPTEEVAAAWVEGILAAAPPRLFVLYWGDAESDPQQRIERQLAQRTYKARETWIGDVRLAEYGLGPLEMAPRTQVQVAVGDWAVLEGVTIPTAVYHPGDIIAVTLFWQASTPPPERVKVFIHVMNAEGTLVAQNDAEPGQGFLPTTAWAVGETLIDRYGLWLPPELPSGELTLQAGMYRFSGERLPVATGGDVIVLGQIMVQP